MVAFDYSASDGRVVKMYASYPTCEDFVNDTLLKTERKHFYELIPEEMPCKLYLDVEWIGTHGPEKAVEVVHHLIEGLKAFAQVRIIVKCSKVSLYRDSPSFQIGAVWYFVAEMLLCLVL